MFYTYCLFQLLRPLGFAAAILFSIFVNAQVGETQFDRAKSDSRSTGNAAFSFQQTSYLTKLSGRPELNESEHFFTDFLGSRRNDYLRLAGQGRFGYISESRNSYLVVEEAFIESERKTLNGTLGRRFQFWSDLDRNWRLGQWEPVYNVDPLKPVPQGLTGLFVNYQQESIKFVGFISAVYMPSLSPEIKDDGQGDLIATSRWSQSPSAEFPIQGKSTQILYNLEVPEIEKIVMQPSVGANVLVGDSKQGLWVNTSYANKPINDLGITYKGVLKVEEDGTFGDVTLVPKVIRHDIYSGDFGNTFENGEIVLGLLKDVPYNQAPMSGWNYQQMEAMEAFSVRVRMNLYNYKGEHGKVGISRLRVSGGASADLNDQGDLNKDAFAPRAIFRDAVAFDFLGPIYKSRKSLLVSEFRLIHDFDQQGSLLNAEFRFTPVPNWGVIVGSDILGVNDDSVENQSASFLNRYRANDRVYAGATYVF